MPKLPFFSGNKKQSLASSSGYQQTKTGTPAATSQTNAPTGDAKNSDGRDRFGKLNNYGTFDDAFHRKSPEKGKAQPSKLARLGKR